MANKFAPATAKLLGPSFAIQENGCPKSQKEDFLAGLERCRRNKGIAYQVTTNVKRVCFDLREVKVTALGNYKIFVTVHDKTGRPQGLSDVITIEGVSTAATCIMLNLLSFSSRDLHVNMTKFICYCRCSGRFGCWSLLGEPGCPTCQILKWSAGHHVG